MTRAAPSRISYASLRGLVLAATLAAGAAAPARAGDPAPAPPPVKAPAPAKAPPPDGDLDSEATIKREALSDPRNVRRDAFPVLREPRLVPLAEARGMSDAEWVLGVTAGGRTAAFPANVLNEHEVVVDAPGGVPLLLTWCPLCRTGAAFLRTLDGQTLDFGHSGLLYRSNFLLYDRGTGSLWHSAEGRALTGRMRGRRLDRIPVVFLRWDAWKRAYPDSVVLAKDPARAEHLQDAYAARNLALKLSFGLGVRVGDEDRLYEFSEMERTPVVADTVGGAPVLVVRHGPTESSLAWLRTLDDVVLDLRRAPDGEDGRFLLETSGQGRSTFDGLTGECIEGPLKGKHLSRALASHWEIHAWMAHHPRGTTYRASVAPAPHLPEPPRRDGGDGAPGGGGKGDGDGDGKNGGENDADEAEEE